MRYLWLLAGWMCVSLGIIGSFLPLLPTVPFLLLAAFCFSKGSKRLHEWLLTHKKLGPPIIEWQKHGAIRTRVKVMAMTFILASVGLSLFFDVPIYALAMQLSVLSVVSLFILTRPAPPKGQEEGS